MADSTPFLIINPNADNMHLGKKVSYILNLAKNIFGDFKYEFTQKIGDGIPIARKAVNEGYNTLVAIGGDGTLNELVNVAAKTNVKIGMVPGGSACDSHKTHGIPRSFERSLEIVNEGYYERFPVGLFIGDTKRYFIEMVNGAFIGKTSASLYDRFAWAHGELGYGYAAIRVALEYKPILSRIVIDNKIIREVATSCITVALTDTISDFEFIPGNHPRLNDFAIFIGSNLKGLKIVRLMLKAINGNHLKNKNIEILHGKHVIIESEIPHTWETEGEIPSRNAKKVEVQRIPDAINLIIPQGWKYGIRKAERNKAKKNILNHRPPFC